MVHIWPHFSVFLKVLDQSNFMEICVSAFAITIEVKYNNKNSVVHTKGIEETPARTIVFIYKIAHVH